MERRYTTIIRKSKLEYVAVCLELNISARGEDLANEIDLIIPKGLCIIAGGFNHR
jgi:hypothetical protein